MSKILSKGIELGYKTGSETTYTKVPDLVSIPQIQGTPEKVETTTLDNEQRTYISGLKDVGGDVEFGFVYDDNNDNFETLKALEGTNVNWEIKFPGTNGLKLHFSGEPSVYISGIEVGSRVDFGMSIALSSDVTVA